MANRSTHIEVSTPAPGDGEEVSMQDARQAVRPGYRLLVVMVVSLVAAVVVLGIYWAISSPSLHRVDLASGGHGQEVTTDVAPPFHAPGPAAKTKPPPNG